MRGTTRIQVIALLAASGMATGGLVGLALGAAWPWGDPSTAVTSAVTAAAVALDVLRVRPPGVRAQVPAYWGRIFDARIAAVLYGARLGIGPLTMLPTWLWWAAIGLGAATGPWVGAATGASYALARSLTSWVAGEVSVRRGPVLHRFDGRARVLAAVLAGVSLLGACSDDEPDDAARSSSASEDTTPTLALEPEATPTTTPEDDALADLLLDETLPGFVDAGGDVLDLDAAAAAESDPEAERALLETRRFVRGVDRRFTNADEEVVFLLAYEFAEAEGAAAYLVDGTETLLARGAEAFEVPEVDGARGFTTREDAFVAHAVAFTRGERWFLVLVGSEVGTRTADEARQLAAEQAARAVA